MVICRATAINPAANITRRFCFFMLFRKRALIEFEPFGSVKTISYWIVLRGPPTAN
jgi:hypothetical protein